MFKFGSLSVVASTIPWHCNIMRCRDANNTRESHRGNTGPAEHLLQTTSSPIWPPLISL